MSACQVVCDVIWMFLTHDMLQSLEFEYSGLVGNLLSTIHRLLRSPRSVRETIPELVGRFNSWAFFKRFYCGRLIKSASVLRNNELF